MAATAHPTEPAFDRDKAQQFADRMVGALNQSAVVLDRDKAQQFADRMVGALNQSAVVLMTSIGHRSGLFDVMARHDRLTSAELARAAALDERYVREWLGAMAVTGAVVEHVADHTYRAAAGARGVADARRFPTTSPPPPSGCRCWPASRTRSSPASATAAAYRTSAYPRFHEVMMEESEQTVLAALVEQILPIVPDLIARLRTGIDALDVGCGSGRPSLAGAHLPQQPIRGRRLLPGGHRPRQRRGEPARPHQRRASRSATPPRSPRRRPMT